MTDIKIRFYGTTWGNVHDISKCRHTASSLPSDRVNPTI